MLNPAEDQRGKIFVGVARNEVEQRGKIFFGGEGGDIPPDRIQLGLISTLCASFGNDRSSGIIRYPALDDLAAGTAD